LNLVFLLIATHIELLYDAGKSQKTKTRRLIMPLALDTSYSGLSDKNLLPMVKESEDSGPLQELLLRSVNKKGVLFSYSPCPPDKAIQLCKDQLRKNPQHGFYYLIMAMHSPQLDDKRKYLELAANATVHPCGKQVSGAAAFELAVIYKEEGKYVETMAWMAKAILCNYKRAHTEYLGTRHDSSWPSFSGLGFKEPKNFQHPLQKTWVYSRTSLSLCTFVAVILSDSKLSFADFTETGWYSAWVSDTKQIVLSVYMVEREAALLDKIRQAKPKDPKDGVVVSVPAICNLLNTILSFDPVIFHDFFQYAVNAKIISEEVYHAVMQYFLTMLPEFDDKSAKSRFEDMGYYSYAKNLMNMQRQRPVSREFIDGIIECINRITNAFSAYNADDFVDRKNDSNDRMLYQIFKLLLAKRQYGAAFQFLDKINKDKPMTANVYDADIFDLFRFVDMDEKSFEVFTLKQKILKQIISATQYFQFDEGFLKLVMEQSQKINDEFYQLRMEFFHVIAKLKEIQVVAEAVKAKNSAQFAGTIAQLESLPELLLGKTLSFQEWQQLKQKFISCANAWSRISSETEKLLRDVNQLLNAISKRLITLEDKANKALKNIKVVLPPPSYPKYPEEGEQMQWAIGASLNAEAQQRETYYQRLLDNLRTSAQTVSTNPFALYRSGSVPQQTRDPASPPSYEISFRGNNR